MAPRVRKVKTKAPPRVSRKIGKRPNAWDSVPDPGAPPDPNCTHSLTSRIDGHKFCSYCGGDLTASRAAQ